METEVIQALQKQLNHERTNAQKYFYMAAGFDNMAYPGFAKFFNDQATGELGHAGWIGELLISKNIMPEYAPISGVVLTVGVLEYAQMARQTELMTTEALKQLYHVAEDYDELQVCALVDKMLLEQIEEENVTLDFLTQVQRTDQNGWEVLDSKYK